MDFLRRVYSAAVATARYLAGLQWTHHPQPRSTCLFCNLPTKEAGKIIYDEDGVYAIENRNPAGKTAHYLIFPKEHIRDIENLDCTNLRLLDSMQRAKEHLLADRHGLPCPTGGEGPTLIHSGFHRGRRPLIGNIYWPDVVSVHHLHLHVIVEPKAWWVRGAKYPTWMWWMWRTDASVMRKIEALAKRVS